MADQVKMTVPLTMNPWLASLVIGIAICGAVYFVGDKIVKAQVAALKTELAQVKKDSKDQLGSIDDKVDKIMGLVKDQDKQVAQLVVNQKKLEDKESKDQVAIDKLTEKLKDAPPETLVAEGRRILQTKEINYLKPTNTVEFSLAAYRTDVMRLTEWEGFTLSIVPDLRSQITNLKATTATLSSERDNLKNVIALDNQWKNIANNTMDHYYNLAMKSLVPGFWKQFLGQAKTAVPSYLLGFATGFLVKK